MEGKFGGQAHHGLVVSDVKADGRKSVDWDLNHWKWDGDRFTASPLNAEPSDCRSRQLVLTGPEIAESHNNSSKIPPFCLEENNPTDGKRRRVAADDDGGLHEETESLNFNLGGQVYPIRDGYTKSGKKTKIINTVVPSNRTVCQVDDCKADLSNAKDYHRRHKVCEMHSKASTALMGNVVQRFCQQCSRFHALQEFDEGKRSCRKRLAGHNKRRRKTHPDNVVNGGFLPDQRSSSYLLISLLRILSNMQSNNTDAAKDQNLLHNLLKSMESLGGLSDGRNISGLLQGLVNTGMSSGNITKAMNMVSNESEPAIASGSNSRDLCRLVDQTGSFPASSPPLAIQFESRSNLLVNVTEAEAAVRETKMNNIDLNSVYIDGDNTENSGPSAIPERAMQKSQQPSPSQISGKSDSTSSQSPSSSSGEAQSHTDRIVFKLFGKEPSDIPVVLRSQILDWLSHSPTDIEGYIRPGCIVLTVYLRLGVSSWDELYFDLGSKLKKLLDASNQSFWRTGWIYTRVQHHAAFIFNGQVVLDTHLPLKGHKNCRILSITPIAVPASERAQFVVKGFNFHQPATRLLCALEGKYLAQETPVNSFNGTDAFVEYDELHYLSFSCSIPDVFGRGFIEVEDNGLSSSFFPFIVAEREVCSEICMLEGTIEAAEIDNYIHKKGEKTEANNQALDFIHEMGWLLRRSQLKFGVGVSGPDLYHLFPFPRFKWIMEFSLDHEWCAVVKKLLDILFDGTVDSGDYDSVELALISMSLLHRAVRRNCRPMVELLLRYVPGNDLDKTGNKHKKNTSGASNDFIFKPDIVGPAGLTPLHVAASIAGSENMLDALTDDPGMVGIEAWNTARDSTGLTPNDYACLRGYLSYTQLVQRKIRKKSESKHVVLDIPNTLSDNSKQKNLEGGLKTSRIASFHIDKLGTRVKTLHCKVCEQTLDYGRTPRRSLLVYKPAMLSMVAIAAVCVCAALLFKSSPEVLHVFRPFCWELLKYGSS